MVGKYVCLKYFDKFCGQRLCVKWAIGIPKWKLQVLLDVKRICRNNGNLRGKNVENLVMEMKDASWRAMKFGRSNKTE